MDVAASLFEVLLLIWFFGCVVTYRFGKVLLVEGVGTKGAEFIWFVIYAVGVVLKLTFPFIGNWIVLIILILWLLIQYFCHWHFTFFGASKEKIRGYNQCFEGTLCIIPRREDRLIPDFYHIVLHSLIVINIVLLCLVL